MCLGTVEMFASSHMCSISLFSEQLHDCLSMNSAAVVLLACCDAETFSAGMRPDDVIVNSLVKTLKGIENFMHPL